MTLEADVAYADNKDIMRPQEDMVSGVEESPLWRLALLTVLYTATDEPHQSFVSDRHPSEGF